MVTVLKTAGMAAGSPQWRKTITASKIPAILGIDPFTTTGELWMRMSGMAAWPELEGDHLTWGHIAEDSLVNWWLHKHPGWQAGKGEVAYSDESLPFPNQVLIDRRARRGRRFHIIECKTSDSTKTWGGDELPAHVAAQVLAQMGISGIHEASVVAQIHSTVPMIHKVQWEPELWDAVVEQVAGFYESLGSDVPPTPPADVIEALTPAPVNDKAVEATDAQACELITLLARRRDLDVQIEAEKQRLVDECGSGKIKVAGKLLVTTAPRRFSKERLPDEVKHLATADEFYQETTIRRFNEKAFKEVYPNVHALGFGAPEYKIGKSYV